MRLGVNFEADMGALNPMRWLRRSSVENPSTSLSNPAAWLTNLFAPAVKSGVVVNEETALCHAAVFACNRVLSETIASLPLDVFEQKSDGDTLLAGEHPVQRLVNSTPNSFQTSFNLRSMGQLHLGLKGNFYALIIRDNRMRPVELRPLNPNHVKPHLIDWRVWYKVTGMADLVSSDDMLHVLGLSYDGVVGKSPIAVARETIGLGLAATNYSGGIFKNGTHLSGVLEHPEKLTSAQITDLRGTWKSSYSGMDNAGNIPILQNGMKFVPISMTPEDAKFIETAKLSAADMAAIYRVPLHMIGQLDRATFSNIEQQSLEFVRDTIRPWIKNWEQELNRKLFRADEQGRYFCRFNLDALLRGDTKTRAEFYAKLFNVGALSQNEIRHREGLNRIEGGDQYFVQLNMSNQSDAAQIAADNQQDNTDEQTASAAN